MSKNGNDTKAPAKPGKPNRRRKARIEDHPDVKEWCAGFVRDTENAHGFTPTEEQAVQAFLVQALKALGRANHAG